MTTPGGTTIPSLASVFTYQLPPIVTGLSPAGGSTSGDTSVTITGQHLSNITAVYFGTVRAYGYWGGSDTSVTVWSPSQASGTVDVTVQTLGGTSATSPADQFTYSQGPIITGLSPYTGPSSGGTFVTISGLNFSRRPP